MGPGDFFGEGGVVSGQPRGASVRAATPVEVSPNCKSQLALWYASPTRYTNTQLIWWVCVYIRHSAIFEINMHKWLVVEGFLQHCDHHISLHGVGHLRF